MNASKREIPGFPGYYIFLTNDTNGQPQVIGTKGKMMKTYDRDGYKGVTLSYGKPNKKKKKFSVHTLAAMVYIQKPESKENLQIDHKNSVKSDNYIDLVNPELSNLRWVTPKENIRLAIENGRYKDRDSRVKKGEGRRLAKPVIGTKGSEKFRASSISEAAKIISAKTGKNCMSFQIHNAITNHRRVKTVYGWSFKLD